MRYFTEKELKDYYKKIISEGEYATEITVGEYSTPQEANTVLDTIRKQYGFGRYDSRVDGTAVKVVIEKDPNDDSYFYDMINQMKNFGKQYKQVAENTNMKTFNYTNTDNFISFLGTQGNDVPALVYKAVQELGLVEKFGANPQSVFYRLRVSNPEMYEQIGRKMYEIWANNTQINENTNMKKMLKEELQGDYYVVAVDKTLSGWGNASGGKSVVVVKCHTDQQAHECEKSMENSTGIQVKGTYYGKVPNIKNAAHIQEMDFEKCPQWNKDYYFKFGKSIKESYDMNRVSRWGKRNGYELNGNVLSNGDEDITFTDNGEYDSSSSGFPSSDFEEYMKGTPASSDELRQYISSKIGDDYRFTQAIAEYDEEAMGDIANDMSQEMDCTPEEALDAIHKVANEYAYYNPSEGDLQESAKKGKKKITESQLRNVIAESVKSTLNESDYKTYLWAAQQAKAKGDNERAQKFYNYAQELYNQQYNTNNGEDAQINLGGNSNNYGATFGSKNLGVSPRQSGGATVDGEYKVSQYGSSSNMNRSDMMNTMRNQYPKSAQNYANAENDLSDFRNGKYTYNNGWKKINENMKITESQLRAMIAEAITEALGGGGI